MHFHVAIKFHFFNPLDKILVDEPKCDFRLKWQMVVPVAETPMYFRYVDN